MKPSMNVVTWIDATKELPDDETAVLIALSDGEVWIGFHEADEWRLLCACCGEGIVQGNGVLVTHWAEFPDPPSLA
jgi:hypothetical protein